LLGHGAFWKIKEKKIEKKINIDLAMIASQSSERRFMTSIILNLACVACKDRFNFLLFNHSLEFFLTT